MEKSATAIIDEVREKMCNDYCKYLAEYNSDTKHTDMSDVDDYSYDKFMIEHCDKCPLNRL